MLRLLPSDPNYAEVNRLASRLCEAVNAHIAWDTRYLTGAEQAAAVAELTEAMRETIEELSR